MNSKFRYNLTSLNICGDPNYIYMYPKDHHKYTKIRTDEFWQPETEKWQITGGSRNFSDTLIV